MAGYVPAQPPIFILGGIMTHQEKEIRNKEMRLYKAEGHSWDNVRLAHKICNTKKSAKLDVV